MNGWKWNWNLTFKKLLTGLIIKKVTNFLERFSVFSFTDFDFSASDFTTRVTFLVQKKGARKSKKCIS